MILPIHMIETFIIPSVSGEKKLPANPAAIEKLNGLLRELASPQPLPIVALPETARKISEKSYKLDPNWFGLQSFALRFDGSNQCQVQLEFPQIKLDLPVGLNGVYRTAKASDGEEYAVRGYWQDKRIFLLEYRCLRYLNTLTFSLLFKGKHVDVTLDNNGNETSFDFSGKASEE